MSNRNGSKARRQVNRPAVPAGPVTIVRRKKEETDDPGILVFTIQGEDGEDDRPYYMPRRISGAFALRVLDRMREMNSDTAAAWLLEEVLGPEAYQELLEDDDLEPEQLRDIVALVSNHVLGQVEKVGKR